MSRHAFFLITIVLGQYVAVRVGHAETPTAANPQAAAQATVRKALAFMASDMRVWRQERSCAACHHGPMYVWAASVAERQGYAVDAADVAETRHWMVSSDEARIFRKTTEGEKPRLSQGTIFLAHALNASPADNTDAVQGWQQIAEHWVAAQHDDGTLTGLTGRPPIFNSAEIITRLAAIALAESKQAVNTNAPLADAQRRAETWLAAMPGDDSHQGLVLRLWHRVARREPTDSLVESLRGRQREDGGWSQSAERASDAFATGQSLVVLHRAGVSRSDARVRRAIDFLVRSQQSDGTWMMTSRPDPESGEPAELLNPITYAATAWAALGISSYVPETAVAVKVKVTSQATGVRTASKRTADTCPIGNCPGKVASGSAQGG